MKSTMRRPHRKTRTGCAACKARRIKCDEEKPRCRNCGNRGGECTYSVPSSTASHSGPSTSTSDGLTASSQRLVSHLTVSQNAQIDDHASGSSSPVITTGSVNPRGDAIISGMNMLYLELLHHFTTSTCFTLNTSETLRTVWRVDIPRLALSFDFVMHSILALSALHLAQFSNRKDFYISHGLTLHQSGLRIATPILTTVTKANCAALWIFNSITCLVSLASPRRPDDILFVGETGIAEWLLLLRGNQSMIFLSDEHLRAGPLGSMFLSGHNRTLLRERHAHDPSPETTQLDHLAQLVTDTSTNPDHLESYIQAIDELRASFNVAHAPGFQIYESADVFVWLFRISDTYLNLLTQRTQESLVIFAHFCVVLKRFDNTWYMNGWSNHLMQRIHQLLDPQHRSWIRWAIEETGIVLF